MKLKQMHILTACADYEGDTPIRAFESKDAADAYKALCDAHTGKKPEFPVDVADAAQNDKAWGKYEAAFQRWKKKSPAGADAADSYYFAVVSVPYNAGDKL